MAPLRKLAIQAATGVLLVYYMTVMVLVSLVYWVTDTDWWCKAFHRKHHYLGRDETSQWHRGCCNKCGREWYEYDKASWYEDD